MHDVDSILSSIFGLEKFRLQQREIVNDVLAGRDALVVMPTGAGKSLCFQLPAVALRGLTLIISPLISLMTDQVRQMRALRIPAMMLCSGQTWDEQREVMGRMRDGFRGMLYVAPERFNAPGFFSIITQRKLSLLAIDEAHCISQWGHDFRPEYLRLGEVRKQLGEPLTIALTATATPEVRRDIVRNLELKNPAIHVTGFDRPNLSYQSIVFAKAKKKQEELVDYLSQQKAGGIVYCSTRKHVEEVTTLLKSRLRKRTVVSYHAGMEQEARGDNQRRFIAEESIVVATNAFGMGINKPNLRYVIHYDMPGSLEAYYQEAGRAGRDGLAAECILYFAVADVLMQKFFIEKIGETNEQITKKEIAVLQKRASNQLNAMQNYARWERCRRRQILEYFGEDKVPENCDCDVCRAQRPRLKVTGRAAAVAAERQEQEREQPPRSGNRGLGGAPARAVSPALAGVTLAAGDVRLARMKELRRDVVRALGTMFFQYLPDELLQRLIASPPKSVLELRDEFEVHIKIIENFGTRMLHVLSGRQEQKQDQERKQKQSQLPHLSQQRAKVGHPTSSGYFHGAEAVSGGQEQRQGQLPHPSNRSLDGAPSRVLQKSEERTTRAKVAAAKEIAGGKVGALHGRQVEARFERLRTLRLELARKNRWPAYCVLQDATLLEIARSQPRTMHELLEIKGMGPKRAERYGKELLAEVAKE